MNSAEYFLGIVPNPSLPEVGTEPRTLQSIARRCKIQRVTRCVSLEPSSAQAKEAWKIFLGHDVAVHKNLGTVTCSLVGNPTTGRSTSRRVMWSRSFPDCPQSGHTPETATGVASMMVNGPASAAPVMASPISAVRQMVSATRFPVGFTVRVPGGCRWLCRNFHLHTRDPYMLW